MIVKVKDLERWRTDVPSRVELWKDPETGQHYAISYVEDIRVHDVGAQAITNLTGMLTGLATSGEECAAFPCDEEAEEVDFSEAAAMENGSGCYERCLEAMGAQVNA